MQTPRPILIPRSAALIKAVRGYRHASPPVPRTFATPADVSVSPSPSEYHTHEWNDGRGAFYGSPLPSHNAPDSPLYHVTSNLPAIESSGYLRASSGDSGGLGSNSLELPHVSLTPSRHAAVNLRRQFGRMGQIARGEFDDGTLHAWAGEDARSAGLPEGTLTPHAQSAHEGYTRDVHPYSSHRKSFTTRYSDEDHVKRSLMMDAYKNYLRGREGAAEQHGLPHDRAALLSNPHFTGNSHEDVKRMKTLDDNHIGIVATGRNNLPQNALLSHIPADNSEVRVYGDVPLPSAKFVTRKAFILITNPQLRKAYEEAQQPIEAGFHTNAEKLISRMGKQMHPDQVSGMVKHLPQDELEHTGLTDHVERAKQQGMPVNRDRLLSTIRSKTPKIETKMLGGESGYKPAPLVWKEYPHLGEDAYGAVHEQWGTGYDNHWLGYEPDANGQPTGRSVAHIGEFDNGFDGNHDRQGTHDGAFTASNHASVLHQVESNYHKRHPDHQVEDAIYDNYSLPGGENYRELLLKTPSTDDNDYQSPHWGDHPNVIAHVRMKDRTDSEGKKALHLEEVQSDWHQDGRDKGYKITGKPVLTLHDYERQQELLEDAVLAAKEKSPQEYRTAQDALYQWSTASAAERRQLQSVREYDEENRRPDDEAREYAPTADPNRVPDVPFKGDHWQHLALKHALLEAAKGGYDKLSWNPSHIQNGEVNRPEDVSEGQKLNYDKKIPDWMNKFGKRFGVSVGSTHIPNAENPLHVYDSDGQMVESFVTPDDAQDFARRNAAEGYYAHPEHHKVHSLDITPAMRESILRDGLPMWGLPEHNVKKAFILIKSVGSGSAYDPDDVHNNEWEHGFHSNAQKITERMGKQMHPDQVSGMMKTLPKEELEHTGVAEHIERAKQQGVPVKRDELLHTIRHTTPEMEWEDGSDSEGHEMRKGYQFFTHPDHEYEERVLSSPQAAPYSIDDSVHFGDVAGGRGIGWIRAQDTPSSYHIEEVQSNRHQQGGKQGYLSIADHHRLEGMYKEYESAAQAHKADEFWMREAKSQLPMPRDDDGNFIQRIKLLDKPGGRVEVVTHDKSGEFKTRDVAEEDVRHVIPALYFAYTQDKGNDGQWIGYRNANSYHPDLAQLKEWHDASLLQSQTKYQSYMDEFDRVTANGAIPDAPLKGDHWWQALLKKSLMEAADRGKPYLSWNDTSHQKALYGNSGGDAAHQAYINRYGSDAEGIKGDIHKYMESLGKHFGVSPVRIPLNRQDKDFQVNAPEWESPYSLGETYPNDHYDAEQDAFIHPHTGESFKENELDDFPRYHVADWTGYPVGDHHIYSGSAEHEMDGLNHSAFMDFMDDKREQEPPNETHHVWALPIPSHMSAKLRSEGLPLWGKPLAIRKAFIIFWGDLRKSTQWRSV